MEQIMLTWVKNRSFIHILKHQHLKSARISNMPTIDGYTPEVADGNHTISTTPKMHILKHQHLQISQSLKPHPPEMTRQKLQMVSAIFHPKKLYLYLNLKHARQHSVLIKSNTVYC